jgi:hypothetical protein
VEYLDGDGAPGATGGDIQYVRVSITGYQHDLMIPFVGTTLPETVFRSSTTIPAESLGYTPPGPNPCA